MQCAMPIRTIWSEKTKKRPFLGGSVSDGQPATPTRGDRAECGLKPTHANRTRPETEKPRPRFSITVRSDGSARFFCKPNGKTNRVCSFETVSIYVKSK